MKQRIEDGRFSQNGRGLGTVTEAMVRKRAEEIAQINGRPPEKVLDTDLDQARRELTGEERLVLEPTVTEQIPEKQRAGTNQESEGQKAETLSASDEQTFAEKLVEEGIQDAEHQQMLEATRDALKRDAA